MKKLNQKQRDQVEAILTNLGASTKVKAPVDKKGNLDVAKFNELPEVKSVIQELVESSSLQLWTLKKY